MGSVFFWLIVAAVLGVGLVVGTLAWWRIGDQWADAEHKKFTPRKADPNAPKPTVIRTKPDQPKT